MMFSNAAARPVVFSKIGEFFSGGFTRTETPSSIKVGEAPKVEGPEGPSRQTVAITILIRVLLIKGGLRRAGSSHGSSPDWECPDTEAPVTPEVAQYREANRKKWQAQKRCWLPG